MPRSQPPAEPVVGQRVCVTGYGTAAPLHEHVTVVRLTKTLIVVSNQRRFNRRSLDSVPYRSYGGTRLDVRCRRPRKPMPR